MKKIFSHKNMVSIFSAGLLSMCLCAGVADAHTGFRDDWISGSNYGHYRDVENSNAAYRSNVVMSGSDVPLDGTYIRVFAYQPGGQKNIGEHTFTLDCPAEVNLHTIGHQQFPVDTNMYDSDGNKLCSVCTYMGEAKDVTVLLAPGRYVIRHNTISMNYKYNAEIEFKLTRENVPNNTSKVAFHRWEAPEWAANVTLYDYIPLSHDKKRPYRYYSINMLSGGSLTMATEKIAGRCVLDFDLLDADENVLKSWSGIYDVHEEKTFDLPAGHYFIRVKSFYNDGGAYSLKYFVNY